MKVVALFIEYVCRGEGKKREMVVLRREDRSLLSFLLFESA